MPKVLCYQVGVTSSVRLLLSPAFFPPPKPHMRHLKAIFSSLLVFSRAQASTPAIRACHLLRSHPSSLLVAFPDEPQFSEDISHASIFATENSTCSVQPRTASEVSVLFQIIDHTRSPFAIKGRGHANNPTHSSTPGVQISLSQFHHFSPSSDAKLVTVGPSLAWDTVYELLEPLDVMLVGGRIPGVGVGGFVLGGGYSYKSNRYGLASDTTVEYELVVPTGEILNVTAETNPDLFYGLQGGLNNFGVVTSITMESHPQTLVYAGTIMVHGDLTAFRAAIAKFDAEVHDPKASMLGIFMHVQGQVTGVATLFYDGPSPPHGIFDAFLALENATGNMNTTTFLDFIKAAPSLPPNSRVFVSTVPIARYPLALVDAIMHETIKFGKRAESSGSSMILATSIEPFQLSTFSKSPPEGSAYPHSALQAFTPFNIALAWSDPADDGVYISLVNDLTASIQGLAVSFGVSHVDAPVYPNYAPGKTGLERMYGGKEGLKRLGEIRRSWDPKDVMSLSGGFIVPFYPEVGDIDHNEL